MISTKKCALFETHIKSLTFLHRGKVRDIYAVDDDKLLIVQTDRISAFDVILPNPVPGKGKLLTALSAFWFKQLSHIIPNHLTGIAPESIVAANEREQVLDRAFVIRKLKPLPVEAIVRGYIAGSGWKDYQHSGAVCGIPLPPGLKQAEKLPGGAIFTPSTKAAVGAHDENIALPEVERQLGQALTTRVKNKAVQLYTEAAEYAVQRGIIIADTKFEFGLDDAGELYLIDEVLTPDSSRFWPVNQYQTGISPPSYDKQFVRDWLEKQNWNKKPPVPVLPDEVIRQTVEKYWEALRLLTA
ncbi:phosphoribosylaminoimidazole-succinocarboxamide synthase [Nitrosomonas aestuarii]|uniref:Phosphoribosylaminoimidazole-succinocarboxamide synthase n=1 Tax=Nitrosomonas aestuarii TaxID=52441 RepID=A0A1I4DZI3_9PROT|nr:phosphoribosylaminoimidazolesuccinocarboxamide synthase [Nitrosomonas aestuarii]SFK97281.1 phosphoribosylaminoimidazole-succinocarboxamide synthase [Nitrosomonas aestuarii]